MPSLFRRLLGGTKPIRLADAMRHGDAAKISEALTALASASPEAIVGALNELADLPQDRLWLRLRTVRVDALRPLFLAIGSKTGLEPLPPHASLFAGLQPTVRGAVSVALGKVASSMPDPKQYAALIADPDPAVRREAIGAVSYRFTEITTYDSRCGDLEWVRATIRPEAKKRVPLLQLGLADADPWVRTGALDGLKHAGDETPIPAILPLLTDFAPQVRRSAVDVLASSEGDSQLVESVTRAIQPLARDSDATVRTTVAFYFAMIAYRFPELVRHYRNDLDALREDNTADARKWAQEALNRTQPQPETPPR